MNFHKYRKSNNKLQKLSQNTTYLQNCILFILKLSLQTFGRYLPRKYLRNIFLLLFEENHQSNIFLILCFYQFEEN